jgi:hypothetical protein
MLGYETKSRIIPYRGAVQGRTRRWSINTSGKRIDQAPSVADNVSAFRQFSGSQVTVTKSHPGWRRYYGRSFHGDRGGHFSTKKRYSELTPGMAYLFGSKFDGSISRTDYADYSGPCLPMGPASMSYPPYADSSRDDLEEYGTTAIARCAPTNPTADLSVFLGETLREGIPRVSASLLNKLRGMSEAQRRKALADEYLNYQFGWKPFVSDCRDIFQAITHADAVISQYERDSGKMVRREYGFPPTESTSSKVVQSGVGPWTNPSNTLLLKTPAPSGRQVVQTDTVFRRVWFSGAFSYYIPMGGNARDKMALWTIYAKKLLGLNLTPGAIWNLSPWSWAVDWFTNAGDVLHNLDAWTIDNQVLLYGYVMEHTVSRRTYTYVGPTGFVSSEARPAIVTLVSETKVRWPATPFGFGLTWEGLNSFQKSIIAALGISKWSR